MEEEVSNEPNEDNGDGKQKAWWTQMVRDAAVTGLATVFMTEDSIRKSLKELKLPKELASLLLEGASKKKDEAYSIVAKEISRVISKIDVGQEVAKFLEQHKIQLEARVTFEKKEEVPS